MQQAQRIVISTSNLPRLSPHLGPQDEIESKIVVICLEVRLLHSPNNDSRTISVVCDMASKRLIQVPVCLTCATIEMKGYYKYKRFWVMCNKPWIHISSGNSQHSPNATDSSLHSPYSRKIACLGAVQEDCEIVYSALLPHWPKATPQYPLEHTIKGLLKGSNLVILGKPAHIIIQCTGLISALCH